MKSKILLVAGACALAMTGFAQAADNTMTVTASVKGACGFSSSTSLLDFGQLDPTSTADAVKNVSIGYWCTKGQVASTSVTASANGTALNPRMKGTGGTFIPFSLAIAGGNGTGLGKNNPLSMTVTGTILNADYVDAAVDSYTDTVTLTLTP